VRRALLLISCVVFPSMLPAQSLLERTPNINGGWTGAPGTVYFNFLHRFTNSGPPERQVTNYPTFLLGYTPFRNALIGINYSTRSDVAPRFPNEYEAFVRYAPLQFASLQAGYNNAAESVDGEMSVNWQLHRFRVIAAGRAFTNGYASDTARFAVAGGALVQVSRWVAVGGDVAQLLDARDHEDLAWSAALQIGIPYTPHTLSVQVANTSTATLQGSSRGLDAVRYGFEFTVPLTLSRFFSGGRPAEVSLQNTDRADMHGLQFQPNAIRVQAGSTVTWRNRDQVFHTVTAEDGSWTSPMIEPGQTFQRRFDAPGRYHIVCTPHPTMKMVVEVVS
jgi:plastocyanin